MLTTSTHHSGADVADTANLPSAPGQQADMSARSRSVTSAAAARLCIEAATARQDAIRAAERAAARRAVLRAEFGLD